MGLPARRLAFEELREWLRATIAQARRPLLGSGIPNLDGMLGGGFPRGALATLEGTAGRWAIVARLLAQATRRGLAAVVDGGELYPPDLAAAGVLLERLIVVSAAAPLAVARAADVLLRSRACTVVALTAPPLQSMLWVRLAGLAYKCGTLLLVVTEHPPPQLVIVAGLRLRCERVGPGYDMRVDARHESVRIACSR